MKSMYLLWMVLLLLGESLMAQSCDSMGTSCTCTLMDLSPAGVMFGHDHAKGEWKFSYRYMSMDMQDNLMGTGNVSDKSIFNNYIMAPHSMQMDMHMVMVMYGITNKLSGMVMANYGASAMTMYMLPGTTMIMNGIPMIMGPTNSSMSMATTGLGDMNLTAVYKLMDQENYSLFSSCGINIPTGSIQVTGSNHNPIYPNQRLPYMMQLGTGTWDVWPSLNFLVKKSTWAWGADLIANVHTGCNVNGYRLGNEIRFDTWAAYKFRSWVSASVRINAIAVGQISGADPTLYQVIEPDANPQCYGGTKALTHLGLNFYCNAKWLPASKFSVEYGLPLYTNLNGPQLATHEVLFASWMVSL